jgi:hypothetical protein
MSQALDAAGEPIKDRHREVELEADLSAAECRVRELEAAIDGALAWIDSEADNATEAVVNADRAARVLEAARKR